MKKIIRVLPAILFAASLWARQNPQVQLDLPQLADKASDTVTVSLNKNLLQMAAKLLPDDDPDTAKIKKLVANLQGIYVRSYEFDKEGEFSIRDLEPLRKTITGTGWNCLVSVHSKKSSSDTDVCLRQDGDKILGLAILSTEPKKLTIVNILGAITPEEIQMLQGQFGIPEMKDAVKSKKKDKEKDNDD
jgi:hypothetical protein